MKGRILLDTGPLVALLNRRDLYHHWSRDRFAEIKPPLLTCEPVLTEACHLLRNSPGGVDAIFEFLHRGFFELPFTLASEVEALRKLQKRYHELPMSLADACLVRMAELHTGTSVLTIDSDFTIYRMHGRKVVPSILPG